LGGRITEWVREKTGIQPLWKFLTFTENLGFDGTLGRSFSHAWSLCVEEYFYLVLPLLLILVSASRTYRAIWVAAAVFVGGLAVRVYAWKMHAGNYSDWFEWIYYPTYTRLDGLLVGVLAAATQRFEPLRWRQLTQHPHLLLCLGLLLLVGAALICEQRLSFASSVFSFPLIAVGYGLVLVAAVSPTCFLHRIRLTVTAFLASVSYSLYLTHKITIYITQTALSRTQVSVDGALTFLICIAVAIGAAWAVHVAVERPFMNLRSVVLSNRARSRDQRAGYVAQERGI
jgi:peptidoglycan/LPS O-acetylase OafA/YrhL